MKTTSFIFYTCTLCLLGLIDAGCGSTQKVANVQGNSQWLPKTAQIDGKLSEWNGTLSAYNKAALVEYTIANDDKNLYLAISSKDKTTTAKILAGGISFILNQSGKDKGIIITFPSTNSTWIYSDKTGWPEKNYKVLSDSTAIRSAIQDLKEIKALRLKGVSDSILSIYNEYGIKSKLAYANQTLVCELLIPLNLMGLSLRGSAVFAYNIRLNGVPIPPRPPGILMPTRMAPPSIAPQGVMESEMWSATDFNGKYTLAKK